MSSRLKRRLAAWLAFATLPLLSTCGKPVEYYPLALSFAPASPVVITVPYKRKTGKKDEAGNDLTEDIAASWFQVGVKFKNNGTKTITVQGMVFVVDVPFDPGASSGSGSGTSTGTSGGAATAPAGDALAAGGTTPGRCEFTADPTDKINNPSGNTYLAEIKPTESVTLNFVCDSIAMKTVFVAPVHVTVQGWTGPASFTSVSGDGIGRLDVEEAKFTTQ